MNRINKRALKTITEVYKNEIKIIRSGVVPLRTMESLENAKKRANSKIQKFM